MNWWNVSGSYWKVHILWIAILYKHFKSFWNYINWREIFACGNKSLKLIYAKQNDALGGGVQLWLCSANQIDWREGIIILIIFCWDKNALISLICKQKFVTLSLLSVAHCRLSIINNTDNNKNFIQCPIYHTFGLLAQQMHVFC